MCPSRSTGAFGLLFHWPRGWVCISPQVALPSTPQVPPPHNQVCLRPDLLGEKVARVSLALTPSRWKHGNFNPFTCPHQGCLCAGAACTLLPSGTCRMLEQTAAHQLFDLSHGSGPLCASVSTPAIADKVVMAGIKSVDTCGAPGTPPTDHVTPARPWHGSCCCDS